MSDEATPSTDPLFFSSFSPKDQLETTTSYQTNSFPSPNDFLTPTFISSLQTPSLSDLEPTLSLPQPSTAPYFNVTEQRKDNQKPNFNPSLKGGNGTIESQSDLINRNRKTKPPNDLSPSTKHIFSPKFNGLTVNTSFLQFEKDKHEFATSFMVHFDFNTDSPSGILFHAEAELNPIVFAVVYLVSF